MEEKRTTRKFTGKTSIVAFTQPHRVVFFFFSEKQMIATSGSR
jgi:hypothetical protein